jgi:hypothetical protein
MRRFVPDAHLTVVHMDAAHIDVEKTISDIELLEQLLSLRDPRPLRESDVCAANQRHDTLNAQNPWFRLWQRYGIPA